MPNILEVYQATRRRVNPEGLAYSGAVSFISPAVMLPVQAGLTYAIHEISKETNPELLKFLAVAVLGIANMVSVAAERKALKDENYSASPAGSILNILTGKPTLSSIGGHLINYIDLSIVNPINATAVFTGNKELLIESEAATALTLTGWFTFTNSLVFTGGTRPFVENVRKMRQAVFGRIKPKSS